MHIIISASPNADGLTAACGRAVVDGITGAEGTAKLIDISAEKLEPCQVCGNGWGSCLSSSKCIIEDIFAEVQENIRNASGIILITPVYWWQPSERMKYFLDRFRRCESIRKAGTPNEGGALNGKQVDMVAAAGGSGNGTATCLAEMETWCRHVGAVPKDRIGVTRFNRDAMLEVITDMAARLVKGEHFTGF